MALQKQQISDPEALEETKRKVPWPQRVAASPYGMVATAHHCATEAGVEILSHGGNAVDAAVAAAFALGVCEPTASGLGGQTMMLVYNAATRVTLALDGSSRAPNRATPGSLDREERLTGHRATTVPSTPAVLEYARSTFGTMALADLVAPARALGRKLSSHEPRFFLYSLRSQSAPERVVYVVLDGRVSATMRYSVPGTTWELRGEYEDRSDAAKALGRVERGESPDDEPPRTLWGATGCE